MHSPELSTRSLQARLLPDPIPPQMPNTRSDDELDGDWDDDMVNFETIFARNTLPLVGTIQAVVDVVKRAVLTTRESMKRIDGMVKASEREKVKCVMI